jgi:hypothetical protein
MGTFHKVTIHPVFQVCSAFSLLKPNLENEQNEQCPFSAHPNLAKLSLGDGNNSKKNKRGICASEQHSPTSL